MSLAALLDLFKPHPATEPPRPPITPPVLPKVKAAPWRNWFDVLVACGVGLTTAQKWESVFAEQISPETMPDEEMANFLGQCLHETGMLLRMQEDLSYSAERMMAVWPRRFPTVDMTAGLVMNPRALAERVYGGRMGNELAGDGFKYRGRGFPMVTGRDNYEALQAETGYPLVDFPELLVNPSTALRCGLVWWKTNISVKIGSSSSVEDLTKLVNGGLVGIDHRRILTESARRALSAHPWK